MTGSAALSLPLFAGRAAAADVDVVVIGAGAAGIAAARELRGRGLTVTVVEASSRIGGRVHTDTSVFGVPYDVGAHWLHYREENPFADYAEENGFDLYESPSEEIFYVGDREATDEEYAGYEGAMEEAARAMTRAAVRGKDVSPASVMPDLGEWALSANLYSGAYEMAKDFDHLSCKDWYTAEDGTDYYVREGFGTLFAHSARDVEVALNTPVEEIRWGGSGVEVVTSGGTIQARAAVVTVSMGVLAGGGIKFDPPLPAKKQEAIGGLTMGHYLHVALQLDENFFGVGEDGYFGYKITEELNGAPMGFGALVDAAGTGITYCDLGGEFAREMSRQGSAATTDFVISELTKIFGSKARAAVRKTHTFDWTSDPLTLGAYASAEPGFAWTRRELRKPEGDRLWFAGEATSKDDWATVAGAHKAGIAAARKVAKKLKA